MKVAFISSSLGYEENFVQKIFEAIKEKYTDIAHKLGHTFEFIEATDLIPCPDSSTKSGVSLKFLDGRDFTQSFDATFVNYSSINIPVSHHLNYIHQTLITNNFRVINNLLIDKSKYDTFLLMRSMGIKTIPTIFLPTIPSMKAAFVKNIENEFGLYPFLLKPDDLFGGIGVTLIKSKDELSSIIDICSQGQRKFILQKFIKSKIQSDTRCYVIDGQIIVAYKRTNSESILSNISGGGTAKKFEATNEMKSACKKIHSKFKLKYFAADFIESENDYILSEIELAGGWTGVSIESATKIMKALFDSLERN